RRVTVTTATRGPCRAAPGDRSVDTLTARGHDARRSTSQRGRRDMSRNPILTDRAFQSASSGGTATMDRPSPADEWNAAQAAGAGATAGAAAWTAQPGVGVPPVATTTGRTMTLGGVAAATLLMFAVLLVGGALGWSFVDIGRAIPQPDGTT